MKKLFVFLGIAILLAVLLVNRLWFPLNAVINIVLCVLAAGLLAAGILIEEPKRS